MDAFLAAVPEYYRFQSAKIEAIKRGEPFQFEEELAKTSERRLQVKYAIVEHQEQRGC